MAKIVNKYPVGMQTFEEIREKGYLLKFPTPTK